MEHRASRFASFAAGLGLSLVAAGAVTSESAEPFYIPGTDQPLATETTTWQMDLPLVGQAVSRPGMVLCLDRHERALIWVEQADQRRCARQ